MRSLIILVAIAVVAAACGGEEDSGSPATTIPVVTPVTTGASPPAAEPTTAVPQVTTAASQPAEPAPTTTEAAPSAGGADFTTFFPGPEGTNWLQVSVRGGPSLDEQPELCLILNDGKLGKIHAQNFALDWTDDEWTLIWNKAGGMFTGPAQGEVDGITVTFSAEADGTEIQGSVICFEA